MSIELEGEKYNVGIFKNINKDQFDSSNRNVYFLFDFKN